MKCDGRDNTKKPCSFIFVVVPSKIKNVNKTQMSEYSDLEESLFCNDIKSIRNNNETIMKMIIMIIANSNNNKNNNSNNNDNKNNDNTVALSKKSKKQTLLPLIFIP